jgi:hypothetical protein
MTVIHESELNEIAGGNTEQDLQEFLERMAREWPSPSPRSPFPLEL